VSTDRSTKYLVTARMNAGKELIMVMLVPDEKDGNAKVKFSALVDTLIRKECVPRDSRMLSKLLLIFVHSTAVTDLYSPGVPSRPLQPQERICT
jgi:hypothetical protein